MLGVPIKRTLYLVIRLLVYRILQRANVAAQLPNFLINCFGNKLRVFQIETVLIVVIDCMLFAIFNDATLLLH